MVILETIKLQHMWTVKCALDMEGIYMVILKNFTEKAKSQAVKLRKSGNGKTPASKLISTKHSLQLSCL